MVCALFVGIFQLLEPDAVGGSQVLFFLKGCGCVLKEIFYPVFSVKVIQRFC